MKPAMFDQEIRLLELCSDRRLGVRKMLGLLGGNHTSSMRLMKEFERCGFIEPISCSTGRGRPRKIATLSPLGSVILDKLRSVNNMMIKTNINDVRSVAYQVRLRNKMIDLGIDPYEKFLELNEIALNIRDSAEPGASIRET